MNTKIYIASPFFSEDQLKLVKAIEHELDIANVDYFSPRSEGVIKNMSPEERPKHLKRIYDSNVDNIHSCHTMIAVLDGSDTGTIFELGYMAALKENVFGTRSIITITNIDKPINVMLRQCVDAHLLGVNRINEVIFELRRHGRISDSFDAFPEVDT